MIFVKRSLNLLQIAFVLYLLTVLTLAGCGGSSSGSASSAGFTATASSTITQILSVGSAMTSFTPLTATGGALPYKFSYGGILPSGLSFDSTTGAVTGTPTTVYYPTALLFKVQDANGTLASTTNSVTFTVNPAGMISANSNASPPPLQMAVPVSYYPFTSVAGGQLPYAYSITSGVLPAGLSLNTSTGLLSGSPTASQVAAAVTFSVQDAFMNVAATSPITFSVGVAPALYVFASAVPQVLTRNVTMTAAIFGITAAGGNPPYAYSASGVPAGLTFNSTNCEVYGTPSASQVATPATFIATDASSVSTAPTLINFTVN